MAYGRTSLKRCANGLKTGKAVEPNLVQFKKGVLEPCVLALLSQADSYGYDIASRLSDAIEMGEGTIYPLMRRMQKDGLVSTYFVESSSGPPRKYYTLTEKGRESLHAQRRAWTTFTRAVSAILGVPSTSDSATEPSSSPAEPADTRRSPSLTVQKNTGNT
ncbi:PadR family transcriptional regulator [Gluconacetobacter entanii]|uniref:PadR family transcriptional regulator n=1 Tax=Gluconacetobacter entanii TaxID=108528 RepID=UPI0021BC199C|nr:PadR family transcriptional regulator [Gluconacetobacter entanii]MCW4581344.1 PadR family transcriptional regulator [Gluconacetobacter entanii]MCW4584816.1 PadR family transcriptional regulator [Gluconacetobacter entanii]MCW4588230.1 PadR family transcriptional regulator [Gluconacetobacter entanii]